MIAMVLSTIALIYVETALPFYIKIDLIQNLLGLVLPFVLFIIALGVAFGFSLNDKRDKIEEYSQQLRQDGLGYIVQNNQRFVIQNYRAIAFGAGKILLRKLEEPNTFTFIKVGIYEQDKEPAHQAKLLSRLHLLPKSFAAVKKEKVPAFYGENVYQEYKKRIDGATRNGKQHKKYGVW